MYNMMHITEAVAGLLMLSSIAFIFLGFCYIVTPKDHLRKEEAGKNIMFYQLISFAVSGLIMLFSKLFTYFVEKTQHVESVMDTLNFWGTVTFIVLVIAYVYLLLFSVSEERTNKDAKEDKHVLDE